MLLATGDATIPPRVSLSTGVVNYLVKPFTRELVAAAVKNAVRWHEAASNAQRPQEIAADSIEAWLHNDRSPKSDS